VERISYMISSRYGRTVGGASHIIGRQYRLSYSVKPLNP